MHIFLTAAILAAWLSRVHGFASWMASDFCDRPLRLEEIIMNQPVIASDERVIKVFRGEEELVSGKDAYIPGEELIVTITEKKKSQFVFETTENGYFVKGGCEGRRSTKSPSKLIMPDEATEPVKIWAGWAMGHEEVKMTNIFVLPAKEMAENVALSEVLKPAEKNDQELGMPDPILPPKIEMSENIKAAMPESIKPPQKKNKANSDVNSVPAAIPESLVDMAPDHSEIADKIALPPKSKLHAPKSSSTEKVHLSKSATDALPPSKEKHNVNVKTEVNHIHLGEERVLTPIKVEDLSKIASKEVKGELGPGHHRSSRMKVGEALKAGKVYDRDKLKLALRGQGLHASPIEPAAHNHVFMLLYIVFAAAVVLLLYKFFLGRFKIKRYLLKMQGKDIDK